MNWHYFDVYRPWILKGALLSMLFTQVRREHRVAAILAAIAVGIVVAAFHL
jgi:hypothetical protein